MFQLKTKEISGLSLFDHQVDFRQQEIAVKYHKLNDKLEIEVLGRHQEYFLAPDVVTRIQHNIMQEIGALSNKKRLTQRKFDSLRYANYHSCYINEPNHIERLQSILALVKSLEAVKKIEDNDTTKNNL